MCNTMVGDRVEYRDKSYNLIRKQKNLKFCLHNKFPVSEDVIPKTKSITHFENEPEFEDVQN